MAKVEATVFNKPLASCALSDKTFDAYDGGSDGCWQAQRELNAEGPRVVIVKVCIITAACSRLNCSPFNCSPSTNTSPSPR